jgi:hypothetical protein
MFSLRRALRRALLAAAPAGLALLACARPALARAESAAGLALSADEEEEEEEEAAAQAQARARAAERARFDEEHAQLQRCPGRFADREQERTLDVNAVDGVNLMVQRSVSKGGPGGGPAPASAMAHVYFGSMGAVVVPVLSDDAGAISGRVVAVPGPGGSRVLRATANNSERAQPLPGLDVSVEVELSAGAGLQRAETKASLAGADYFAELALEPFSISAGEGQGVRQRVFDLTYHQTVLRSRRVGRISLGGGLSGKYGYYRPNAGDATAAAAAAALAGAGAGAGSGVGSGAGAGSGAGSGAVSGGLSSALARLPWPLSFLQLGDVRVQQALFKAHAAWQSGPSAADGGGGGGGAAGASEGCTALFAGLEQAEQPGAPGGPATVLSLRAWHQPPLTPLQLGASFGMSSTSGFASAVDQSSATAALRTRLNAGAKQGEPGAELAPVLTCALSTGLVSALSLQVPTPTQATFMRTTYTAQMDHRNRDYKFGMAIECYD